MPVSLMTGMCLAHSNEQLRNLLIRTGVKCLSLHTHTHTHKHLKFVRECFGFGLFQYTYYSTNKISSQKSARVKFGYN